MKSPPNEGSARPNSGKASGRKMKTAAWEGMFASPSPPREKSRENLQGSNWRAESRKDVYETESDEEIPRPSSLNKSTSNQFPWGKRSEMSLAEEYPKQSRSPSPLRSYSKFDQSYNDFINSSRLGQSISSKPDQHTMSLQLIERINSGQYVDLADFLPHNVLEFSAWDNKHVSRTFDGGVVPKVTEFAEWVQCIMVYISVLSQEYPERTGDLLGYVINISMLYQESDEKGAWLRYDEAFRRKASLQRLVSWSKWDKELWVLATSSEARHNVGCKSCLSYTHDNESCPFSQQVKEFNNQQRLQARTQEMTRKEPLSPKQSLTSTKSQKIPKETLELKFAFGYHGYDACNNVFYTTSDEIVFHTAALGICYNRKTHEQRFYKGHTDDILCLTVHDDKDYVATGQVGKNPATHVWDTKTMSTVSILKGFHTRGIICVDFSGDGKKLADIGLDDDHCICIWDWRKAEKLATTRGHKDKIYVLEWNPFNNNYFVTVGEKHIKFWTHNVSKIEKRPVTYGKAGQVSSMLCVCHSPHDDTCFAGADNGEIYAWQGTTLRRTIKGHKGAVFAMYSLRNTSKEGFVTGGKDGVIVIWDVYFEQCLKAFKVERSVMNYGSVLLDDCPAVRSIHTNATRILIGTGNDEVIEIEEDGRMTIIAQGHGEGEVWGLAVHPYKEECVTVSDDKTVRVWDLKNIRLKQVKKLKKGSRCVCYSPGSDTMAIGHNDGSFSIIDAQTLTVIVNFKDRKEEISDVKFSPDGKFLAVASHDNFVDIYSVKRGKRVGVCKGHSSYVTHVDWDVKGKLLLTNSGAREYLLFEAPRAMRKTMNDTAVMRVEWATVTGVLGPNLRGIFPPATDITDVNSSCRSKDERVLATGDDFGHVKLFNYPASVHGAKFRQFNGHSSHVTNVRWTNDDKMLVTTGGMDTSVLVWERRRVERGEAEDDAHAEAVLVQPKFIPTGPIKNPLARGKPQL